MADLKKGARSTGSTRDKLAADLKKTDEKGASIRALAESTGRSDGFVHRVLSESGVTLRGRGGATRTTKTSSFVDQGSRSNRSGRTQRGDLGSHCARRSEG